MIEVDFLEVNQFEEDFGALGRQADDCGNLNSQEHEGEQRGTPSRLLTAHVKLAHSGLLGGCYSVLLSGAVCILYLSLLLLRLLLLVVLLLLVEVNLYHLCEHLEELNTLDHSTAFSVLLGLVTLRISCCDIAFLLELSHDNVQEHLLEDALRFRLCDHFFTVFHELIQDDFGHLSQALLERQDGTDRLGAFKMG